MTSHPINLSPELVKQWLGEFFGCTVSGELSDSEFYLATQAVRWGADQELEACCEWVDDNFDHCNSTDRSDWLRTTRRPQSPSLKEQALAELDLLKGDANAHGLGFDAPAIRRALETLPD